MMSTRWWPGFERFKAAAERRPASACADFAVPGTPYAMNPFAHHAPDGSRRVMDEILNVGFFVFHSAWMLFNCVGWIWKRTRRWQLVTVSLTAMSWFGLGLWYGWGYCPCTDWHWQVRARLGYLDPPSYIQLLTRELIGVDLGPALTNVVAVVTLTAVSAIGVVLTIRDRRSAATAPRT
jgi:hypothetical protein